jgi:hypothetical protein
MKDKLQPKLPCHAPQKSTDHSSQSASPYARIGVVPVKGLLPIDILTKDLECSSSSEDSSDLEEHPPEQSKPMMEPNEVVHLDGMKLRINLRLVKKEEAKLKTRPRRNSESSSTSCSMEEEDLPLLDDVLSEVSFSSSSSSSPAAKRHKFGPANDTTDDEANEDEIKWLPYRPPSPDNQEDFVKREIEGMREYDT